MLPSDTDYRTKVSLETNSTILLEDLPFHLLFLGNWSGEKNNAADSASPALKPIEIDRDNFDEVFSKFSVSADLTFSDGDENVLSLHFSSLDGFHPDNIFQNLPLFSDLRQIRQQILNPNTFDRAAREVRAWFNQVDNKTNVDFENQSDASEVDQPLSGNLLDQILGQSVGESQFPSSQTEQPSILGAFIKDIIKPHLIQIDTAEQSELLTIVDEVISDLMRKILHHPRFQALESAWRGAHFLVRRAETDSRLKIYLLDLSKDDLVANLKSADDLEDSLLYKIINGKSDTAENSVSWAAICGNYTFSLNVDDAATLIRIAEIASANDSPFVSHIKPALFGFDSFATADASDVWKVRENSLEDKLWTALRVMPEAAYVGLCVSRILVRLPYGEKTDPIETFYFEEFMTFVPHEEYLWINPAFAVGLTLAQNFQTFGWSISQGALPDITGLPLYSFQYEGETKIKSCAEIEMAQANYQTLLNQGLMPIISERNTDTVKINRLQSIAHPESILKGKW